MRTKKLGENIKNSWWDETLEHWDSQPEPAQSAADVELTDENVLTAMINNPVEKRHPSVKRVDSLGRRATGNAAGTMGNFGNVLNVFPGARNLHGQMGGQQSSRACRKF